MPVSLRLLDATAAGTQTLRLLTALVCSVSVTTAVAGPMAYQAIEFRRSHDDVIELSEDKAQIPTREVDGVVPAPGADPGSPPANLTRAGTTPTIVVSTTGAAVASTTSPPTTSTANAPAAGSADSGTATPPAAPAVGQPAATATSADGSVAPAAADSSQTGSSGQAPAVTATAAAPAAPTATSASPTTADALQEFNPRPACDDRAQELNVGNTPACPTTSPP
jgi:hypothetical protein